MCYLVWEFRRTLGRLLSFCGFKCLDCSRRMGCVYGKCCGRYPESADGESFKGPGRFSLTKKHALTERLSERVPVPAYDYHLEYSVLSQRGYYPDSPDKLNQDSFCVRTKLQGDPNVHFFGVFDGHGQFGTQCSNFVKERLVEELSNNPVLLEDPLKAYNSAFEVTNTELHNSEIDDSMSGTTAICVLFVGDTIVAANVGDSRAVIAVKEDNKIVAQDLSCDQTPFRKDECERVKECGARVLSVDQVEGLKDPDIQSWGDEETEGGDPPRIWVQNGMYPGTAFTRSVGDSVAEKIGVVAVPEVSTVKLNSNHLFLVIASDGIFEFLSSQAVVNMVSECSDPRDACDVVAGEAYKLWLEHENRTDDITIIIIHIKDLDQFVSADGSSKSGSRLEKMKSGSEPSEISRIGGSEAFRSMRSNFSDLPAGQQTDRSPVIIYPSPTHPSEPAKGNG
uniref:protein-serine/threonine phosphatase n=1 Tax=Kalanchoe fedtschenkoi TaxID=63787 RepID=A0A7N0UPY0_KALFE